MTRDQIFKLIDDNNAAIVTLQRELAECYAQDKWLHRLLASEPVSYVSNESVEQHWENEGGSVSSPFVSRKPSFNEFVDRLASSDVPPYKK